MITDADIKKMKKVFATKDDLKIQLKPIKSSLKQIGHTLKTAIKVFDRQLTYHHKRLKTLERKVGIEEQPYFPPVN